MTVVLPQPRNAVVVLLDSLNRHLLGSYGGTEFATPHLDRFATRHATRFTRHVTGSLPCMPARHDILCGALDFLWRPWGSIEVWERPITADLRHSGVTTMLVTDHPHLFETGGENYHTDFGGWDYVRGHEGDPWKTWLDPSWIGVPAPPAAEGDWFLQRRFGDRAPHIDRAYDRTRTHFREEADYPGPRTMTAAADWLTNAATLGADGRWMLFVDEFDPHEPFDTPEPWQGMYEAEPWEGERLIWPPYVVGGRSGGHLSEAEARHVRANYGSKLSMIDHWFGRIIDQFDRHDLWRDTALIVCTDHGHYLGEERTDPSGVTSDIWGKPMVPQFEPLGHIPLLIHWPGVEGGGVCEALTTAVDLHATLADVFGVSPQHRTHGHSLAPLLRGEVTSVRDYAIGGVFGNWVQVTDGRWKYARAPEGSNFPLSMWSNRWSTMPVHVKGITELPPPNERAWLDRMPGSTVPVIRQPFQPGDALPFWVSGGAHLGQHHLYDVSLDPHERENRAGEPAELVMQQLLRAALHDLDAPTEQLQRLGL
ncbi:MAG TPA: sulfatase-like hydrolase/transferase [Ilumatobacteraceae bacterium]|nr:sulfatase-like hydrolase/transferase [Ilumatobacteraceae bacterium]